MPAELRAVFPLFLELSGARDFAGQAGLPTAIKPTEMLAWLQLRGIRPNSRMLWYLKQIDQAWLRATRTG